MSIAKHVPGCLLFLLLIIGLPLYGQAESIDWEEEVNILSNELLSRHPDLLSGETEEPFRARLQQVAADAPAQTRFGTAVRLQQVLAELGDPNTRLNYHFLIEPAGILPFEFYWFTEGIYITRCRKAYSAALGKKLTGINGHDLQEVLDSLSTLVPDGNRALLMKEIPRMLTWNPLLVHMGFGSKGKAELSFSGEDGQTHTLQVQLPARESELCLLETTASPLFLIHKKEYFRHIYLPEKKLLYIPYNKCWSREAEEAFGSGSSALFMPSFRDFTRALKKTIRQEEIDRVILDLRHNGGGHADEGIALASLLCDSKYNGEGALYLVAGRETDSEAMQVAAAMLAKGRVTTIGETTSGTFSYNGEVRRYVLPGSGLIISCPTARIQAMDNQSGPLEPELPAPPSFPDFLQGMDPALRF